MKILLLVLLLLSSCGVNKKEEVKVEKTETFIQQVEKVYENKEDIKEEEKQEEVKEKTDEKEEIKETEEVREETKEEVKELKQVNDKVVYLTFDDGPSHNTLEVIRILNENNIKGTFFVIGKNPEMYKTIVENGHEIAIHTYSHKYKEVYASVDAYFEDLYKLESLIYETVGKKPKVVRLPGGSSNSRAKKEIKMEILKRLEEEGYIYQDWNCDSGDSRKNIVDVETIVESSYCPHKKVNLLMHDTSAKTTTVEALQRIIDKYREEGYSFEVLTEQSPKFQHIKYKK